MLHRDNNEYRNINVDETMFIPRVFAREKDTPINSGIDKIAYILIQ